ncbi:MAG TPA: helix-turn-helix domain-containing protein [Gemmatimonadaceae bacterium]|nr:helix-turn-helix domain-containing protein [Gemmatimonadaceae bacterium]
MPAKKRAPRRRSSCPLNASVEMLGDRWSLLIVRDLMLRGARSFSDLEACDEGIASNMLADRLRKLTASGIIAAEPDPSDARKRSYMLTEKGIDLAPVLAEMVLWAAAHEETGNRALVRQIEQDKHRFLAEVRRRWANERGARR